MRILLTFLVLPLLTHARVCGAPEASAEVSVEAKAPIGAVVAPAIVPTHGGQIVYADTVPMEVVVKGDGAVQAYPVVTVQGQAPALPASARVTVNVPVQSGPPREVRLSWRGPDAYFYGHVRGAVVAPGPVNVVVVKEGRRYETIAPVVVTPVVVASSPTVVVEQPSAAVVVQRPSATVVVQRPSATVVVGGGAVVAGPRAGVYVGGPAVDVRVNAPTVAVGGPVVYVDDDRRGGKFHDHGRHRGWYDDGRGPPGQGGHGGGNGHGGGHGGGHGRH